MRKIVRKPGSIIAAIVLFLAITSVGCEDKPTAKKQPFNCPGCNVILISIDTLRADHLGSYGYERQTSPQIDKIAASSFLFENAISQSSWTAPAHASMLSGLSPKEHGLIYHPNPGRLSDEHTTLAEALKAEGYQTASFNGGGYVSHQFGLGQGFDVYKSMSRYFTKNISAAEKWIENQDDKPFFLFLHGFDTHRPFSHSEHNTFFQYDIDYKKGGGCWVESEGPRSPDPSSSSFDEDMLKYIIAEYDADIVFTDILLGGFFDYLEKKKLIENTILIITSDHGEEFYDHGHCDHKHSVFRELVHVPLIIRLPGQKPRRVKQIVPASTSIMPTVLAMLDIDAPEAVRGDSLIPLLHNKTRFASVTSESGRTKKERPLEYWRGLTTGKWKLIYSYNEKEYQLFDWRNDVAEQADVFGKHNKAEQRLKEAMFTNGELGQAPAPSAALNRQPVQDKELQEQLRSLGYLD